MAHDAALESLICGIGYEMTPSEEELSRRRRAVPISGTLKIQHKTSFHQRGDAEPAAEPEDSEQKAVAKSKKLRRAFSLNSYRNPFLRSPKAPSESGGGEEAATVLTGSEAKRRVSWRKFLSKIAAQFGSNLIVKQQASAAAAAVVISEQQNDRVPPLGGYQWPADQTPGVTGLRNHGNTCFMNAVLQCLSHTNILAEYFVLDQYKADLKRRNKINSKKFGTKGELTEQLGVVLKALWTCRDTPEHSSSFKAVVDRYSSQFRSSTQHDAQEFLFWLLDKVHEDLNTATKKRYKSIKNNYGRPDEVIAAETLANHIRCNNSFVQAVFQAQFRSSLTCPRCQKQSNTFDPFHCISVQLPQLVQQPVYVTVVYTSQHPKQVKLGLTVAPGSSMLALKEQLHLDTGIAMERILLTEITESGFSRVFCDSHPISAIKETDPIYCIETPRVPETSSNATNASATVASKQEKQVKIVVCILNVKRGKSKEQEKEGKESSTEEKPSTNSEVERFGTPLCLQVNRDISYAELQRLLLKEMASVLKSEVFAFETPVKEMYKIRLQDPSADPDTYLEATVEHPLFTEMIDLALSVVPSDAGPAHVKLQLEWADPERFFSDMSDPTVEHASVAQLKENKTGLNPSLTLEHCLDHYTKAETLSAEDAWRCPHCQKYLPVVKTLGMWSLPDILVIHFKRFRQHQLKGPQAAKLTTMVKFPMHGFDMSPHLAKTDNGGGSSNSSGTGSIGPSESKYDLYAVCYHQGTTLETGHYTAACLNPYDQQWYRFDDQRVSHVPNERVEEDIINDEAYMLFYQRRKLEGGSECSGSSSSSNGEHWTSRIPPNVLPKEKETVRSTTTTLRKEEVEKKKEKVEEEIKSEPKPPVVVVVERKEEEAMEIPSGQVEETEKTKEQPEQEVKVAPTTGGDKLTEEVAEETVAVAEEEEAIESEVKNDPQNVEDNKRDESHTAQESMLRIDEKVVEIEKEEDKVDALDNSETEIVLVRKSSPIPIQRSSAPLNWSKALDNSLSGLPESARYSSLSNTQTTAKGRDLDTAVSLLRASSSCSKDTFLFIDHRHRPHHHRSMASRTLIDEDDLLGTANHSLWISPVSSHKMITISPKN